MNELASYKQAYFLGIGGIGMSAICRYLTQQGIAVFGYDKTPTPLTESLEREGVHITFNEDLDSLPIAIKESLHNTLVVITPAIPKDHAQKRWFEQQNAPILKRSEVLGLITNGTHCLAVAGTHGKTTTSTLLAHILKELDWDFSSFLGGISSNYQTNYLFHKQGNKTLNPALTVVEADEFDRSFHRLTPSAAIITAVDPDHLDIYQSKEAFTQAFIEFAQLIKSSESPTLVVHRDLKKLFPEALTYGYTTDSDYAIESQFITNHQFHFIINHKNERVEFVAGLPGTHNVLNAAATIALCHAHLEIPLTAFTKPISTFKGVKRRFEYLVNSQGNVVIDDYAHHPEELNMIINSVKELYPKGEITGIFQPHLFTRTRDFAEGFAQALNQLHNPILLDIYPARELPIPGISSEYLTGLMKNPKARVLKPTEVLEVISQEKPKILLILGAGDIDKLREPITQLYE